MLKVLARISSHDVRAGRRRRAGNLGGFIVIAVARVIAVPRAGADHSLMEKSIDEQYGLEPVFEPGDRASGDPDPALAGVTEVDCPYCGERFATAIDLSAGSQSYIEDCQICCQPIEMRLVVDASGALEAFEAARGDS